MFSMFFKGIILGFSIAAPVGPIGLLCIRRTLMYGRLAGFVSGLGAAVADAFYGALAGFGLTFLSEFLISMRLWLTIIGSVFLVFLGIQIIRSPAPKHAKDVAEKGLINCFISTLFLTLTNPLTIIVFMGLFAAFADINQDFASIGSLVLGVFLGSTLWWFILVSLVGLVKTRISFKHLAMVNKIAGILIIGFGIYALITVGLWHIIRTNLWSS